MTNQRKLFMVVDKRLLEASRKIPNIKNRGDVVQSLIFAYDLHLKFELVSGQIATTDDLLKFHSLDYINYLKKAHDCSDIEKLEDATETNDFNLGYDCPLFDGILEFVKVIVGGTLSGAAKLVDKTKYEMSERKITNVMVKPKSYLKFKFVPDEKAGDGKDIFDVPQDMSFEDNSVPVEVGEKKFLMETVSVHSSVNLQEKNKEAPVCVNWFGGWHHAQRDEAEGFCYVNDIVISIHYLLTFYQNIMYLDLDVHHGNGVENAFSYSPQVLTLSFHLFEPGFYPGSGSLTDTGFGTARNYAINVPLKSGITDAKYLHVFDQVFSKAVAKFKPECLVVQCGADSLTGDPLGGFNLTPTGLGAVLEKVLNVKLPTLVLGGGGYNVTNAARCWTYLTSVIAGSIIPDDIPDNNFFHHFGPDFTLNIPAGLRKDENSDDYIDQVLNTILGNLDHVVSSK